LHDLSFKGITGLVYLLVSISNANDPPLMSAQDTAKEMLE